MENNFMTPGMNFCDDNGIINYIIALRYLIVL
jgi:hypothetical protein